MGRDYVAPVVFTIILISIVAIWADSTAGLIGTSREALFVESESQLATAGAESAYEHHQYYLSLAFGFTFRIQAVTIIAIIILGPRKVEQRNLSL